MNMREIMTETIKTIEKQTERERLIDTLIHILDLYKNKAGYIKCSLLHKLLINYRKEPDVKRLLQE